MDKGKYRRGRANIALKELAEEAGYTPGEFTVVRLASDTERVKEWMGCLSLGKVHEDFAKSMKFPEFREFVIREAAELMKRERDILDFFHPKLKATEANLNLSGEVTLLDLLQNADTSKGS